MEKKLSAALEQFGEICYKIVRGNITENTFEILYTKEEEEPVNDMEGLSELWDSYLIGGEVYKEDLEDFRQYANLPFISEFMRKYHGSEKYDMDFRCLQDGVYQPIHIAVVAAEDYTDDNQTIYIFLINAGSKLREDYVRFDDLLRGLSENYGAIYYVDFDKDIIRPFRLNEVIEKNFGEFFRTLPSYEDAVRAYIEGVVSPKDREMMYEITNYDFLKKQLENELAYSHEYRLERNGRERIFRMKIANMEGIGPLHKAVMGFADVSMEKANEYEGISLGGKILIVDEDPARRKLLSDIVSAKYEVVAVASGQEVLDYLGTSYENVSIVIAEYDMKKMRGDELLRQIKAVKQYANIPVIISMEAIPSGDNLNNEAEIECLRLGAMDFILKPYNAEIVRNRINRVIRLRDSTAILSNLEKDPLTGLLTKEFFFARAREYMNEHPDQNYVMWVSDIVGLKLINERYGLDMGDSILKTLAGNRAHFDGFLLGGRIEGDKFAALITEKCFPEYMQMLSQHETGIKFPIPGIVVKHGFYHIRRNSSLPVQGMYDRALLALQKIKDVYGVITAEYDDTLRKDLMMHRQISENAEKALKEHQFQVYYQPKFDLHMGHTSGAEALIRWSHPELGFMNPGVFIPPFEQNGFIRELDLYVWEEVCKMLTAWKKEHRNLIPISVNASRRDFDDEEFAQKVIAIVDRYGLDHSYFHIEITESAYSDNPKKIVQTIHFFRENGFVVELDDFGSGYSSMSALSDLEPDVMKLDMSIIQNDNPESDRSILEFSMHLAKMMRLQTVAEGVETEAQVKRITSLGGDYIQGYYYSKPLPRDQFEEYLNEEKANITGSR